MIPVFFSSEADKIDLAECDGFFKISVIYQSFGVFQTGGTDTARFSLDRQLVASQTVFHFDTLDVGT